MDETSLIRIRLANQNISRPSFERPQDLVTYMGAIQAQDYLAAKWAVAQRCQGMDEAGLDRAFSQGEILRTHLLRPTWHFVAPADITWLLALTAPLVKASVASYYRRLEMDAGLLSRGNALIEQALAANTSLTRSELVEFLVRAGLDLGEPLRFTFLIMNAELDGILCSGPMRGKEHTYALLAERAPQARQLTHSEALAELTRRYFTSHGPATLKDFRWWSSLSAVDARASVEACKDQLVREQIAGQDYWYAGDTALPAPPAHGLALLANFDEYLVGYSDRSLVFDPANNGKLIGRGDPLSVYTILEDGRLIGSWKRDLKKDTVTLGAYPFIDFSPAQAQAFRECGQAYASYLGRKAIFVNLINSEQEL